MTLIEMEGFLRGKCLPGDILTGETNAQYLHRKLSAYEDTVTNLTAQVQGLAAESVGLKHAMSVTLEHVSVMDTGQAGVAAMIINDALHNSETPATDAALAEMRAQGVEMFVQKCQGKAESAIAGDIRDNWNLLGAHASDFAQELRKEQGK